MREIISRIKYVRLGDVLAFFVLVAVFPFAVVAKIFIRDFWLICEDRSEARDNGFWLFRYLRLNHPEKKVAYAIDPKSPDYAKVACLGKVVKFGGISHWFWYIVADKNISSQKNGKPNAPLCFFFEVVLRLRPHNRVFLQHGVTINDSAWLYYDVCRFDTFVCSAQPEYDYVKAQFGYPDGAVQYLGFPRFDGLFNSVPDKKLVLIMPTWREWLVYGLSKEKARREFPRTEYCKNWNAFLNSPELHNALERSGARAIFYPHRNMRPLMDLFEINDPLVSLADWENYDIQDALKDAAVMITDYSSVFFDFAYMKKNVIFWQFDEAEFREKQYREGYFDYHDNPLGKWCGDVKAVADELERLYEAGLPEKTSVVEEFFTLYDDNNCQRVYEAINRSSRRGRSDRAKASAVAERPRR